jgi:hypothetical protein
MIKSGGIRAHATAPDEASCAVDAHQGPVGVGIGVGGVIYDPPKQAIL